MQLETNYKIKFFYIVYAVVPKRMKACTVCVNTHVPIVVVFSLKVTQVRRERGWDFNPYFVP